MSVLLIPSACRSGVAAAPTVVASALLSASTAASNTITRVRSAPPSFRVSARTPAWRARLIGPWGPAADVRSTFMYRGFSCRPHLHALVANYELQ